MGIFDFLRDKKKQEIPVQENNQPVAEAVSVKREEETVTVPVQVSVSFTSPEPHDFDADVIPVEKIIPTLWPNEAGLYPHEILALEYAGKFCLGEDNYQGFWWYRYGVKDMNALMQSLLDRGFVRIGTVSEGLQLYKLDELKKVLTVHELKVSGKKADLISRLIDGVPEAELSECFPRRPYVLTEKGKDAIKYDGYVLYAHRHQYDGIDIYSLNRLIDGHTKMYRDFIWRYFNQKSMEHAGHGDFGSYRYVRYQMAQFVMEENKFSTALALLCEVVYWTTSGLNNGKLYIESTGKFWFPYENSFVRVPPGIVNTIMECKVKSGKQDEEFQQFVLGEMSRMSAPFHIFTKDEVAEILLMEVAKDTAGLEKLYDKAKERMKRKYPDLCFEG